jgi:hypothetical protein
VRHVGPKGRQVHHRMGVIRGQLHPCSRTPGASLRTERDRYRGVHPYLRMTGLTRLAPRRLAFGGWHASVAFCCRRICGRWPAGVGGVLGQSCCESCQAFEEGEHHKTHPHRGLVPLFRWYPQSLGKGGGIKPIAHDTVSPRLGSPSLSQNIWEVSRKVAGEGSATRCSPRDHIRLSRRTGWSGVGVSGLPAISVVALEQQWSGLT